jgi:hypothetical protein
MLSEVSQAAAQDSEGRQATSSSSQMPTFARQSSVQLPSQAQADGAQPPR